MLAVPAWTEMPIIFLTITSEAAIGLLLVFRRTRHMGIAIGLVFHGLLALHPNVGIYSFSAMIYGLYALFLSDAAIEVLRRFGENFKTKWLVVVVFVSTTVWQQVGTRGLDPYPARFRESEMGFYAYLAFSLALAAGYGWAMWRSRTASGDVARERALPSSPPRLLWLMLVPVLISGVSPYIGLKTQGTFRCSAICEPRDRAIISS